ncbi:MAG TPA: glycosyltransferase, partial [Gammaproteobacteria bacterium]|nr:glycosyltransferase [Gammaproteobacteria bacterium]
RYAFYMISGAIKAKKYNIPLILEANEVNGIEDRARIQSFPALCNYFERFLFERCTSIHTVSSYLKNMIVSQGINKNIVEVIPNAIDPHKFSGVKDPGNLRRELKLDNKFVIGFAGWFDNWDRLDLLVEVYSKLKSKHENLALLLVGDGAVLSHVRDQVSTMDLHDVVLTGAVTRDKVHQYISLLDIAVFTHSNDFGSPVVMFEFMGLKIPVVAPDLLPITDVMKDATTASIFERLNMEQYQRKIDELIQDQTLRDNLADNAYKLLMTHHTWSKNAEKIISSASIQEH